MATIGQLYKQGATKATPRKQFFAPFEELYLEPGYNIRDGEVDPEKVQAFCEAFMADEYVPAIGIDVTDKGLRVNDGQHRYLGAAMAVERGKTELVLQVIDKTGKTDAEKVADMLNANDGTPTSPVARANGYARMKADGMTNDQIAKAVHRSPSDVANFLALASCPEDIKAMVSAGQMSYVMAIELSKEHGEEAPAVAAEALEKAKAAGKEKVTKKFTAPAEPKAPKEQAAPAAKKPKAAPVQGEFTKEQYKELADLAVQLKRQGNDSLDTFKDDMFLILRTSVKNWRAMSALIDAYLGVK